MGSCQLQKVSQPSLSKYPPHKHLTQYLQKTNSKETNSKAGLQVTNINFQWNFRLRVRARAVWSSGYAPTIPLKWYLQHRFIVQASLFSSSNGKLIGYNKRGERNIKAGNLHALFVHIWILVCYHDFLGGTKSKCVKFGGPHLQWILENQFLTIFQKTYHEEWSSKKVELLTLQTYFMITNTWKEFY